jgi:hypothetical protein
MSGSEFRRNGTLLDTITASTIGLTLHMTSDGLTIGSAAGQKTTDDVRAVARHFGALCDMFK